MNNIHIYNLLIKPSFIKKKKKLKKVQNNLFLKKIKKSIKKNKNYNLAKTKKKKNKTYTSFKDNKMLIKILMEIQKNMIISYKEIMSISI